MYQFLFCENIYISLLMMNMEIFMAENHPETRS